MERENESLRTDRLVMSERSRSPEPEKPVSAEKIAEMEAHLASLEEKDRSSVRLAYAEDRLVDIRLKVEAYSAGAKSDPKRYEPILLAAEDELRAQEKIVNLHRRNGPLRDEAESELLEIRARVDALAVSAKHSEKEKMLLAAEDELRAQEIFIRSLDEEVLEPAINPSNSSATESRLSPELVEILKATEATEVEESKENTTEALVTAHPDIESKSNIVTSEQERLAPLPRSQSLVLSQKLLTDQRNPEEMAESEEQKLLTDQREIPKLLTDQRKREKMVFEAGNIDISELAEAQARDIAEARMTESAEDRSGNFLRRTGLRIWKHNLFQEVYRQKEINLARQEIYASKNLYAGESANGLDKANRDAMIAITERFTTGIDDEMDMDLLHKDERDSKRKNSAIDIRDNYKSDKARVDLKVLIREYAGGDMDGAAFNEEKSRILSGLDANDAKENTLYGDNLLHIAEQVRKAVESGEMGANMDFDVNLTLGKARESLKSEANLSTFDTIVEKLQNSKIGRFVANEPAALLIAAGLYSVAQFAGVSATRSTAVKIGTFGAGVALAGIITGAKESARVSRERIQHMREGAKGAILEGERRDEMEESRYGTESAADYIGSLTGKLETLQNPESSTEGINSALDGLALAEARIRAGDRRSADLITYSGFDSVETERTQLDILRAKMKVELRKYPNSEELKKQLEEKTEAGVKALEEGEEGLQAKDKRFKSVKAGRVAKAALKSMLITGTLGVLWQEVVAGLSPDTDGIVGGAIDAFKDRPTSEAHGATLLESLHRWIAGTGPRMPVAVAHEVSIGNAQIKLPGDAHMLKNSDDTYTFSRDGQAFAENLKLSADARGNLTPESLRIFESHDMHAAVSHIKGTESVSAPQKASEYLAEHKGEVTRVHREVWYDNDTPRPFDKNELRAWFGGSRGTGIDVNGNYSFNMQHMTPAGSYHEGATAEAQELMNSGKLKMLFSLSKGTQHQVFEVSIDANGQAVIPKDSEIAKLMFKNVNGHAMFTGAFAEVAHATGVAPGGGENVRILSTLVGQGHDTVDHVVNKVTDVPLTTLDIPQFWNPETPFPIPIIPRTPLEAAKSRSGKPVENIASDK